MINGNEACLINVELSLPPMFAINELTDERSLCKVCCQFHVDDITFDSYRGPRASDKASQDGLVQDVRSCNYGSRGNTPGCDTMHAMTHVSSLRSRQYRSLSALHVPALAPSVVKVIGSEYVLVRMMSTTTLSIHIKLNNCFDI